MITITYCFYLVIIISKWSQYWSQQPLLYFAAFIVHKSLKIKNYVKSTMFYLFFKVTTLSSFAAPTSTVLRLKPRLSRKAWLRSRKVFPMQFLGAKNSFLKCVIFVNSRYLSYFLVIVRCTSAGFALYSRRLRSWQIFNLE